MRDPEDCDAIHMRSASGSAFADMSPNAFAVWLRAVELRRGEIARELDSLQREDNTLTLCLEHTPTTAPE